MDSHHHQHNHTQGTGCNCCSMSRRCFLATAGAAAGAAALAGVASKAYAAAGDPAEYVDLASLRPSPRVRITYAIVRQPLPYWLGWPGTSYDVEGWRQRYGAEFQEIAKRIGVELNTVETPLESDEAVAAFAKQVQAEKPDAVLVMVQHLACWGMVKAIADAGVPLLVFAPVGTCFTNSFQGMGHQNGMHIVSSLETSGVEQAMRMVRAKRQFEESRLLVLRPNRHEETKLARLGTTVTAISRDSLPAVFATMPENDEVHECAKKMLKAATKVVEPSEQDAINAARSYTAAKRLMADQQANAITTDCLGMVTQKEVPTPPCMAAAMFQDAGVTYGCEADIDGALSLMLTSYLLDKPGFMNDPVPETVKNLLIVAHCVSGTKLNGFSQPAEPYVMRNHSESALGVSLQVLWREGQPVTLVRFKGENELILDTGTVVSNVQTPPAGGCRTNFEVLMDRVEDARDVLGFHQVVFYGNHRRQIMDFCQLYGIKVINSPERTPLPGGDAKA